MFEKVNPAHPDKVADRIAGAIVDYAYKLCENPRIAVEVMIGHGVCTIIAESSKLIDRNMVKSAVRRISGDETLSIDFINVPQDEHLSDNQREGLRCGDNGIFKGVPVTFEQSELSMLARELYSRYNSDGKYILTNDKLIVCQSNAEVDDIEMEVAMYRPRCDVVINPLGFWTGGTGVDTGATNRKLGSDMGDSITGGGLHGKDLSKADVSVNIYAFLRAQETGAPVEFSCAIGDSEIDGKPYSLIVDIARKYISDIGGFEKFAEWGLI